MEKKEQGKQDNVKTRKSDVMISCINCIRKVLDKDTEIVAVKAIEFIAQNLLSLHNLLELVSFFY